MLYLYGARKPIMFHTARWLKIVEQGGGRAVGIDGAGHWFMEEQPDHTNEIIETWLNERASAG